MAGFEGIGDFNSDDPWDRYIAHQAAKGNYPGPRVYDDSLLDERKMTEYEENPRCPNCQRVMSIREFNEQGCCNDCNDGTIPWR